MRNRLPMIFSTTALLVAVFGVTPLGQAVVSAVPPFAKKAGFANNAGAVNRIKAARKPKPGFLVPLGADGKFPVSVGQVGSAGPKGDPGLAGPKGATGPQGPPGQAGVSGWQFIVQGISLASRSSRVWEADCPSGKKALGGGVTGVHDTYFQLTEDGPAGLATGWQAWAYNAGPYSLNPYVWVICASVS